MANLIKRYVNKAGDKLARSFGSRKISYNNDGSIVSNKPRLEVTGTAARYVNPDGTTRPYKKNIVDKVVDRVLER